MGLWPCGPKRPAEKKHSTDLSAHVLKETDAEGHLLPEGGPALLLLALSAAHTILSPLGMQRTMRLPRLPQPVCVTIRQRAPLTCTSWMSLTARQTLTPHLMPLPTPICSSLSPFLAPRTLSR